MTAMEPLRILLVDDHILFRKGIAALLSTRPEITVVGEASDGLDGVEQARQMQPDLILMDIEMPDCNGLEAVKLIKQEMPQIKIIMLTVSDSGDDLFAAIKHGAQGYLLKNLEPDQLFSMLEGVIRGEAPMSGIMAAKILREFQQPDERRDTDHPSQPDKLSEREVEVLQLVVDGLSNKAIAEKLHITRNTVKMHLRSILEKLHVQNRVQAAVYAVREGLIPSNNLPQGT
jgi:DNA-binding NarL/FixJ family response regulator